MKSLLFSMVVVCSLTIAGCSKSDVVNSAADPGANDKPVGSSAKDFLAATNFQSIQLEVAYMPGYAPDDAALNNVVTFLNMLINKPGGIVVSQHPIAASGKTMLTLADIVALEKNNRAIFNDGNSLGVYLMFVDAAYNEPNVLGIAYKNTSLCIFGKTVDDNSGGINQPGLTKLETTVEEHEFGHLLGLVNLGSPMVNPHIDTQHGNHCVNTACLMYYATQVNMMGGILMNGPVPVLDENCRNDLRGNGGK